MLSVPRLSIVAFFVNSCFFPHLCLDFNHFFFFSFLIFFSFFQFWVVRSKSVDPRRVGCSFFWSRRWRLQLTGMLRTELSLFLIIFKSFSVFYHLLLVEEIEFSTRVRLSDGERFLFFFLIPFSCFFTFQKPALFLSFSLPFVPLFFFCSCAVSFRLSILSSFWSGKDIRDRCLPTSS